MNTDSLQILAFPTDYGGCGQYRIRQPFEMITKYTNHEAHVVDETKLKDESYLRGIVYAIESSDLIVARPMGSKNDIPAMVMIRQNPEFATKKIVMDLDDNPEMVSPYSAHYMDFGVEEIYDRNLGKWLWKDGEEGFDLEKNRSKLKNMIGDFKRADMITVTTEKLAEYARQYNKNVAVLPNCINPYKWWQLPLKPNKKLRIALQGGYSHYEDWEMIREPLNQMLRDNDVTLLMVGYDFSGIIDKDVRHKVEAHDWVHFEAHSYRMMCLNIDIAIIPLDDTPFNHYKSSIKLCEFSAMGVPSIVSNVSPYKEEAGRIPACYFTKETFKQHLETLIEDEKLRRNIGNQAREAVLELYDAKKNAKLWTEAYASLN